ncbi:MAG: autotransporter domain-containing protein [Variovorax sp.]|nr:MAG: autotransporter domain-containing protein [Variovorax sp.]
MRDESIQPLDTMNRHARPVGRTSQARSNRNLAASTPDFRLRPTIVGLALVAVVMMAPSAEAATRTWNGNISSDWLTGGNWSSGAVPTASDFIYINSSSPRAASLTGTTAALVVALGNPVGSQGALTVQSGTGKLSLGSQLQIGLSGKGEVSILQGGSIAANSAVAVGVSKGSQGTLNADGAGSALTTKTQVQIGVSGSGTVTVSNSAQATVGTDMLIGVNANSEGKIQISGTGSTVGVGNFLQVGKSGRGALDVSNGGTLKTGGPAILGGDAIGHGTVTLSDDGTQMTTGQLLVGSAGTGELTVGKGAKFTTTDDAHVGDSIGSSGTVTVTGSGSAMSVAGDIGVGEDGTGELSIQDGASVVTGASATSYGDLYIGENKDGSGTVLVQGQSGGVGSTLTVKGQITVGSSGNGAMTVSNGGVANAGDSIFVGASTGGTGALTVADAGSRLTTGGDLQVGSVATGSMTVTDGAKVSVDRDAYVGLYSGADGTLTVTRSATLDVSTGTTNVGDSGTGRMTVSNGGRLNTIDVLIGNQVDGKGDVTVSDAGSRISALRDLVVGGKGRGTLSVIDGALVEAGNVYVGESKGGSGAVSVDGAGARLTVDGNTVVGAAGLGTIVVSDGGALTMRGRLIIGEQAGSLGGVTVTGVDATLDLDRGIRVGAYGTGLLAILDGAQAVTTSSLDVGVEAGAIGTLNIAGPASRLSAESTTVGYNGTGNATISDGGTLAASSMRIGFRDTASGSVTVDGADSLLAVQGPLTVGQDGSASLLIADKARATVGEDVVIGANRGDGALAVTGQGAQLTVAEGLIVGQGTSGALSILDGAEVDAQYVNVGQEAGGSGLVKVAGTGSLLMLDFLTVADGGTGAVEISAGGGLNVSSTEVSTVIGVQAGVQGSVLVTGAGSSFGTSADLQVGGSGTGTLRVADGARASVGLDASVGTNAGADGTVTVTGAASTLSVQGTTLIGNSGTGMAAVSDGGTLTTGDLTVGNTVGGHGNVTVQGAGSMLSASGRTTVGGGGTGELSVLDGARTDAGHVAVGRDAGGSGLVAVAGTGSRLTADTLTVADGGTGAVEVSAGGGLSVTSTEVSTVVGAQAGVQGSVRVTGTGSTLDVAGDVTVGQSGTGTLSVSDGAGLLAHHRRRADGSPCAVGTVTVDGAGSTLDVRNALQVGVRGDASLTVSGGARATVGTSAVIGADGPGIGAITVTGTGSRLGIGDEVVVGQGVSGNLTILDGGQVDAGRVSVGKDIAGVGTAIVSGAGARLDARGDVHVGESGAGSLRVADGGVVSVGGDAFVGTNASGDALVSVTGASSSLVVTGTTSVGQAGLGIALVDQGGRFDTTALRIGASTGLGYVNVDGAGSQLAVSQALDVGRSGRGLLTVTNGAQATSAVTSLGSNAGSIGAVRLAGAGSSLTTGDVFLGRNDASDPGSTTGGTSGLTVTDGATLHAGTISVATSAGSVATLDVGADATSAAAAPGTIDARRIVFGQGDGVLVLNHTAQDLAFAPTIDGAGRVQALSGTTTLASGNTYAGGTSITGATTTLKGSATSFGSGAIRNDGALVIDQASDAAFANAMAGTGALTKTGAGMLNLTGDSSGFTGATTLAAGRLAVNGSLAGSIVTAQAGTTLSGAGTVGGVLARTGSTVAPGNSPGTLSVTGDYHQASGATYAAEVVPGGTVSDRIAVSGTATLDSGSVIRVSKYGTGGYVPGTRYTVLSATGGVTGTYVLTGETDISAFYALGATYDANHVYLDTVQMRPLAAAAATPNQAAAASGVQSLALVKGLPTAIGSLRTDEDARKAFDQLSGELHASVRTVFLEDSRFVREATTRQVHASGDASGSGESVWAHAYGASGRYDGDGNAAGLQRDIGGMFVGTDAAVAGGTRLGVVGGYGHSRINLKEGRGSATVDTYSLGLYGGTQWDRTRLSFGANEAWHKLSTNRSVGMEGFADQLSGDYRARTTQLYGDVGYRMGADLDLAPAALEPFASLAWVDLRTSSMQEKGGAAALGVASGSTRVGFATLGLRSAATLDIGGVPVVASGLLGWRGVLGGTTTPSSANGFAGGAGFVVQGVPLARNVAALEANVSAALTPTLTLGLSYAGQIGSGFSDHGVKASLAMKF